MKIKLITIAVFIMLSSGKMLSAQQLVNAGSEVYVADGTHLVVNSDYNNLNDGQISNNGNIDIYGNWDNNGSTQAIAPGGNGRTTFRGGQTKTIGGSNTSRFNRLYVNGYTNLSMNNHIIVDSILDIQAGSISLNDYNLNLGYGQDLSQSYMAFQNAVVTNGTGKFQRIIPTGESRTFRLTAPTYWAAVSILNHSSEDLFSVNKIDDILTDGTTGVTIPEINHTVPITWNIYPSDTMNADYWMGMYWWYSYHQNPGFDSAHCAIGHYQNSQWNATPESPAFFNGTTMEQHLYHVTHGGSFAVGDVDSPLASLLELHIDLNAFLEGPFNGTSMNSYLNTQGLIPLSQPFNTAPWNYDGNESVSSIPADVVDWVLVEYFDDVSPSSATPGNVIDRQAAFILSDGSVVGSDGNSPLAFYHHSLGNNLYVLIHQRNHLSILSAYPLVEDNGVYTYDFTTSTAQAYQSGEKDVNGVAVMYGGDANADGIIDQNDGTLWYQEAGTKGYLGSDANLDGQSDNRDKNDIWYFNNGQSAQLPGKK